MLLNKLWRLLDSANSHYEKFADGTVKCIDDEIPYEIPQSWCWCRFSAIYRLLTDGTHNTPKYTESGVPFISVKDMSSGKLSFSNTKFISEEEHKILSARCCPEYGDLLISKVGTTGIPLIIDTDKEFSIFVSLALIKFFPNHIDSKFLIHLINSPLVQEQVKRDTRGVGNKNWVLTAISNTLLAIPPLVEQKRIVSKIEEIMPIADKYEKSQEALDRLNTDVFDKLKKSVLQEAIQGKLVPQDSNDEPTSVLVERIKAEKTKLFKEGKLKKKDLVDSVIFKGDDNKYYEIIDGKQAPIDSVFDFPESWQVVRLRSICLLSDGIKQTGSQVCLDAKYLRGQSSPTYLQQGKFVEKGDNIILVDGENSGEVFTAPIDGYMGSTFKQLWISSNLHLPYVLAFIRYYKDELRNSKKGAAIPHLNKDIFNNLIIGIPPYDEQVRIIKMLNSITSSLN